MLERTYTVEEAAEFLHRHPETIRKLVRDGYLKAFKAGRLILFTKEQLDNFLEPTGAGR